MTPKNLTNLLRQVTANGIIAVGMTFVILTGGIDISVGSVVGMSSLLFASFFSPDGLVRPFQGASAIVNKLVPGSGQVVCILVAAFFALLMCAVIGVINGFIITKCKIPEFIVTMSTQIMVKGFTLIQCEGHVIYLDRALGDRISWLGSGRFFGIPVPVIVAIIIVAISILVLNKTTYGRYVRAIGGNPEAARVAGINVDIYKGSVYIISAVLSGIAGILITCRTLSGEPLLGDGYELDAIAGTVIGGTAMLGGIGNTIGTVFGVLILGIINNLLNLKNVSVYYQYIIKGLIILFAVYIRTDRKKK
ncbi:MAG: ABC transporter permease [Eubacterium sp.]|nr:ABC transporter permease [Eubacterium sp.]